MALSEEERRRLEQLEAALAAEDPKLANALRGTSHRWHRRRLVMAGVGFIAGLAALVGGMEIHPALSILGFLAMLAASVVAVGVWRHGMTDAESSAGGRNSGSDTFMDRMEDRWRHRPEDGL